MEKYLQININGINTQYQVSNKGNIKNKKGLCMKQHKDKNGYYKVGLYLDKKTKLVFTHRLVASAFLLECEGKIVHYKNGLCDDNSEKEHSIFL